MEIVIKNNVLGIEHKGNFTPAKGVITHVNPDLDALAALTIFEYYGIQIGEITFKSAGKGRLVEEKTPEQWLKEGWVLIDVGAGVETTPENSKKLKHLDHHPAVRYPGQCATSVAFDLIAPEARDEKMAKFVNFVKTRDLRGTQVFLDLAHVCKILAPKIPPNDLRSYMSLAINIYLKQEPDKELFLQIFSEFKKNKKEIPFLLRRYLENVKNNKTPNIPDILRITSEEIRDIIRFVLEETYNDQVEFRGDEELFRRAEKITFGENRFLVFAETDSSQFMKVALKEGASVIIMRNARRQVQIFTQKRHKVNIGDIAAAIRCEEIRVRGNRVLINPEKLREDGIIEDVPNWFLYMEGRMLLNGSLTTPDQEPTKIELEKIVKIVLKVLNTKHENTRPIIKVVTGKGR